MTRNVTIIKLPTGTTYPWAIALRINEAKSNVFHAFIEDLKASIPSRDRKWVPSAKFWMFKDAACDVLIALLDAHGLTYEIENEAPAHRQLMSVNEAATTLYLLPTAPAYIVDCVYRAMAKRLHPDAGGSNEQMQRINAAVEVLRGQGTAV
jgi:hypothetical protein